ncbi:TPA: 50S ribosomal protein L10 [Candidatus Bipolaricaulota bacterium]|nr:50S ribosomal protein L10 [Candidatus Bipolaricaulota bacterium]
MPNPKKKKEQELALLEEKFQRSKALVFTGFSGLSAQEMVELRRLFRKNQLEYRVVKNTLARLAARRAGLEIEEFLVGPTGVLISYSDAVVPFKVATEVAKRYKQYEIKGGLLEGHPVAAAEAAKIAALPGREELLARLAFVLQAPIQKLAGDLDSILRRLAVALNEVRKQKEQAQAGGGQGPESAEEPEQEQKQGQEQQAQTIS